MKKKGELHDEIETVLGDGPASTGSRRSRICGLVPIRVQRRCPWPACRLGSIRRQGTAPGTGMGEPVD